MGFCQIPELNHFRKVAADEILVGEAVQHFVRNVYHFRPGDLALRLKAAVGIARDPALGRRGVDGALGPVACARRRWNSPVPTT